MGLIKFIMGVLGVLLIIGTASSFLFLAFMGGLFTGDPVFAILFPVLIIIIGAIMVYFGFYHKGHEHGFKISWFIKWGLIHSLSMLIASFILSKLQITTNLIVILGTAFIISLTAYFVRGGRFDLKNSLLYLIIHAFSYWIGMYLLLPQLGITDGFFKILLTGFLITGITSVSGRLNLRKKEIFVAVALLFILVIFTSPNLVSNFSKLVTGNSSTLQNYVPSTPIPPEEKKELNPLCVEYVKENLIGNELYLQASGRNVGSIFDPEWISAINTEFTGKKRSIFDSYDKEINVVKSEYRTGTEVGEFKEGFYGTYIEEHSYRKEDVTDNQGKIRGDNYFSFNLIYNFNGEKIPPFNGYDKAIGNANNLVTFNYCHMVDINN